MPKAYLVQTGTYLPNNILTNSALELLVDTSDEWIFSRTGIKERRLARPDEFSSDMGGIAAKKVLEKSGVNADEIDLILVATLTPDYQFPSTACLIQELIGASNAAAFDIQAACTGWIYGLSVAKAYVESGAYRNVLLVAPEKLSSIIDYEDRSTCVLFGDGAAACLITADANKGLELGAIKIGSDGKFGNLLKLPAGGCRNPASEETIRNRQHFLKMEGREVFKHAVRHMETAIRECLDVAKIDVSEVAHFVPHQANNRIIDLLAKRCGIEDAKIVKTLELYGNTSASSIGIALDKLITDNGVKGGDHLVLVGFGSGLTWGAMVLTAVGEWD